MSEMYSDVAKKDKKAQNVRILKKSKKKTAETSSQPNVKVAGLTTHSVEKNNINRQPTKN